MLINAALGFVNHVLAGADWATGRLRSFAGQSAQLTIGRRVFLVQISSAGIFERGEPGSAAVSIVLPENAPILALLDRPALSAAARISGSADFAEALSFIFRNLRWDVEDDLAHLVGDIAARRMLLGGRQFAHWHFRRARNFLFNVSEFLTAESPMVAHRDEIAGYCSGVSAIRDDCERVEKLVQREMR